MCGGALLLPCAPSCCSFVGAGRARFAHERLGSSATSTMPTMQHVLALRADCFADDVDVRDEMISWQDSDLIKYFESGGEELPTRSAPMVADFLAALEGRPLRLPARILSLHGGGGNLAVNKMQMGRIKNALGPNALFDFFHGHR